MFGQLIVFIHGIEAISDFMSQSDALDGWWPDSARHF